MHTPSPTALGLQCHSGGDQAACNWIHAPPSPDSRRVALLDPTVPEQPAMLGWGSPPSLLSCPQAGWVGAVAQA